MLVTFLSRGDAARILLVPVAATSHVYYFAHLSEPLLERGHEVYGLMNGACRKSVHSLESVGVHLLLYYTPNNDCFAEEGSDALLAETLFKGNGSFLDIASEEFLRDGDVVLTDSSYIQKLKDLNFDLSVVDGMGFTLYTYILPYKLDIPYVTLTTSFFGTWANVPALPSFTPFLYESITDKMTFLERVRNTINLIKTPMTLATFPGSKDTLIEKYAPEKPYITFRTLQRRSKLWLINTDPILDYPRASLPHIVHVGGLTTRERKPLPEDLNQLVKQSKAVAVISFGTLVHNLPRDIIYKLIAAFRQFEDVTFIFKFKGADIEGVPANVHLKTWVPQNDLLGHPAVRLFITHCGNNGQFEALYHAVPMIGLPIFGDQFYGAKRMAVKGFGIAMDTFNFSIEDMVSNIREILNNDSYEIAIDRASQAFHDRTETPKERAAFWIEHIIKFGADHLISSAVEMPWYQFWLVDVFSLFFFILSAFGLIMTLLLCAIIRSVSGTTTKDKKD